MNIIITGASKGIGFQLVKLFANNETNKVLAIARSKNLLQDLKHECIVQNKESNVIPIQFDIEDPQKVKDYFKEEVLKYLDSVDILINNAGFLINKPFEKYEINEIQKTFNINIISPSILIQELTSLLEKSDIKHVINISSMGGFQGSSKFPGLSFYSSSKAALANITECLAEEYKDKGISFNCLALGAVNTKMLQKAFPDYSAPINPPEMANYIYDFALNGYKYYNGKILPVSISTP